MAGAADSDRCRLVAVTLDEASIGRGNADQEYERLTAIHDLIEANDFALPGHPGGPYVLHLGLMESKLAFDVRTQEGTSIVTHILSLTPFRRILKDYFFICESYFAAIRTASPSQIEAIDMGRRGLHDEAGQLLKERLKTKIEMDFPTARRLFTLVMALHWKG